MVEDEEMLNKIKIAKNKWINIRKDSNEMLQKEPYNIYRKVSIILYSVCLFTLLEPKTHVSKPKIQYACLVNYFHRALSKIFQI